jgi:N-acetylmuramoyl-L-alanine amidase CwlA
MSELNKGLLRAAEICEKFAYGDGDAPAVRQAIASAIRAEASQPASQPDSVVVPSEPTQAMHVAMYKFFHEINYGASAGMWEKKQITTELYKTMLRAAKESTK